MSEPQGDQRLLLIDDDSDLCEMLDEYLALEGFDVQAVHNGAEGLEAALHGDFNLVILDVMLPGMNGLEVLRRLRGQSAVPVLMLTARGDDVDRIVGLEIGADDYLAKPFNTRELVARIRAILRRVISRSAAAGSGGEVIQAGSVVLDTARWSAAVDGQEVKLTGAEYRVLEVLVRRVGQVVSREDLTEQALGRSLSPYDRAIDTHVSNLRKKLAGHLGPRLAIRNIRGAGYLLAVEQPEGA